MRYASIRNLDVSNGEGVGVALFTQGCRTHCKDCFNQETWDFNGGYEWTIETHVKFLELVSKPYITRVTLLGGEPLEPENLPSLLQLLREIKHHYPEKKIWLYTSLTYEAIMNAMDWSAIFPARQEILKLCDVLVDGPFVTKLKDLTLPVRGSSNQRIIDVPATLQAGEVKIKEWGDYQ